MDVRQAYKLLPRYKLVDVRTPKEYAEAHVLGAINIPMDDVQELEKVVTEDTLLICRSGNRSGIVAERLGGINVEGGMIAWKENGLPIE